MCSKEKENVEEQEYSRAKPPLISGYKPVIGLERAAIEAFRANKFPPSHGMSQTGACARKLWSVWNGVGQSESSTASIVVRQDGEMHETDVVRRIRELGKFYYERDKNTGRQFQLVGIEKRLKGKFRGRIDGIMELDLSNLAITEVKSVSGGRFSRIRSLGVKLGAFDAWSQIQMYLRYRSQLPMKVGPEAVYLAKSKADLRLPESEQDAHVFYEELVPYDEKAATELVSFEEDKSDWIRNPKIVPAAEHIVPDEDGNIARQFHDRENDYSCKIDFCPVAAWCHKLPLEAIENEGNAEWALPAN